MYGDVAALAPFAEGRIADADQYRFRDRDQRVRVETAPSRIRDRGVPHGTAEIRLESLVPAVDGEDDAVTAR